MCLFIFLFHWIIYRYIFIFSPSGPGYYRNSNLNIGSKIKQNRKDIFINTCGRSPLAERHQIDGLGPGLYNTSGSLMKQSYNIHLTRKQ